MSDIAIEVNDVWKQYRLGLVGTRTMGEDLNRWWAKVRGKPDPYLMVGADNDRSISDDNTHVWALQGIDFKVKKGEVLGIIGKNGAGKSTLLKLLSQVTAPSKGSIRAKGRIASLLEVGTGMHPELTGKENIFLNGAILGMTKSEIKHKIDEIIDFAGIERYVDTPVKRYSSGMRVRLGFAVAAFLEPEILIVDEVLAVGDAEFQKKAIGKMQDVSRGEGRTVLFVSHNMGSIRQLCSRTVVLKNGGMVFNGNTKEGVDYYLSSNNQIVSNSIDVKSLTERTDRLGTGEIQFANIKYLSQRDTEIESVISGDYLKISIEIDRKIQEMPELLFFVLSIKDKEENNVLLYSSDEMGFDTSAIMKASKIEVEIPNLYIRSGIYYINLALTKTKPSRLHALDFIENARTLQVLPGNIWENGKLNRPGPYAVLPGSIITS